MHLIIDGFGCDPERLSSPQIIKTFLIEAPDALGMRRISPVHVQHYQGDSPEQCGISGFVIIAESHLAVHTWPERGVIWADIFSCKPFDAEGVLSALIDAFGATETKSQVLERRLGLEG
jgi:S-adenosylmethionine decarboxylase